MRECAKFSLEFQPQLFELMVSHAGFKSSSSSHLSSSLFPVALPSFSQHKGKKKKPLKYITKATKKTVSKWCETHFFAYINCFNKWWKTRPLPFDTRTPWWSQCATRNSWWKRFFWLRVSALQIKSIFTLYSYQAGYVTGVGLFLSVCSHYKFLSDSNFTT